MNSTDIGDLARKLATAVRKWSRADSDVAEAGWTKENEWVWDDSRSEMIRLADEILAVYKSLAIDHNKQGQ